MVLRRDSAVASDHGPRDLQALALKANDAHREAEALEAQALEPRRRAGAALLRAKQWCEYLGEPWLPWLKRNFEGSPRQAQMYMKIARDWESIPETKRVSLRGALASLVTTGGSAPCTCTCPTCGREIKHRPARRDSTFKLRKIHPRQLPGAGA